MTKTSASTDEKRYRFDLKRSEVEVLLRACEKYRVTLPIYLQSSQQELEILERVKRRFQERIAE